MLTRFTWRHALSVLWLDAMDDSMWDAFVEALPSLTTRR